MMLMPSNRVPWTGAVGAEGLKTSFELEQDAAAVDAAATRFAQLLQKANSDKSQVASTRNKADELLEAARALEAHFLKELLTRMRATVPRGGLFEQSFASDTYEEMLDAEYAESMAKAGGIGLAELLYQQLLPYVDERVVDEHA